MLSESHTSKTSVGYCDCFCSKRGGVFLSQFPGVRAHWARKTHCSRSDECATSTIESIVAINVGVCYGIVTNLEAEDVGAHEAGRALTIMCQIPKNAVAEDQIVTHLCQRWTC